MNALELMDARSAERSLGSVTLCRVGALWQCAVQSAATDSYAVLRKATPTEALMATLELLAHNERYDTAHKLAHPVTEALEVETATQPAGIFD